MSRKRRSVDQIIGKLRQAANSCKTGGRSCAGKPVCDPLRGKTAGCCTWFRTAFSKCSSAVSRRRIWRV